MLKVESIQELRAIVQAWRRAGDRTAFVPTMGNLHAGHIELVRQARGLADRVVVSIFVNPLQFGVNEDFASYPRTLDEDRQQLGQVGTDLVFIPAVATVYPDGQEVQTRVLVPGLSGILCGASRPGHFEGVATVVCKLFNLVQPDLAVFGEKDFQQLSIIRRMVRDLCLPIEILGVPTVREVDGLAMSSRNGYLTPSERRQAPALYRVLRGLAEHVRAGERDFPRLEREGIEALTAEGFRPDYLSLRRIEDLQPPGVDDQRLILLAAAFLGRTRLIDNLRV